MIISLMVISRCTCTHKKKCCNLQVKVGGLVTCRRNWRVDNGHDISIFVLKSTPFDFFARLWPFWFFFLLFTSLRFYRRGNEQLTRHVSSLTGGEFDFYIDV